MGSSRQLLAPVGFTHFPTTPLVPSARSDFLYFNCCFYFMISSISTAVSAHMWQHNFFSFSQASGHGSLNSMLSGDTSTT